MLQLQFTTGAETIFTGIRRLLPGETLSVAQGKITGRTTLAALPADGPRTIGEAEALRRLDDILMDSVNVHQRADVPYGLFLSSGIDSAAILACMSRLDTNPVQAYTACFPRTGVHDEYDEAHKLAQAMGARHIKIEVTAGDFWRLLPRIVACVDDPTADYAIVPTYILAKEAAKDLKVVLCGEGGDESSPATAATVGRFAPGGWAAGSAGAAAPSPAAAFCSRNRRTGGTASSPPRRPAPCPDAASCRSPRPPIASTGWPMACWSSSTAA